MLVVPEGAADGEVLLMRDHSERDGRQAEHQVVQDGRHDVERGHLLLHQVLPHLCRTDNFVNIQGIRVVYTNNGRPDYKF